MPMTNWVSLPNHRAVPCSEPRRPAIRSPIGGSRKFCSVMRHSQRWVFSVRTVAVAVRRLAIQQWHRNLSCAHCVKHKRYRIYYIWIPISSSGDYSSENTRLQWPPHATVAKHGSPWKGRVPSSGVREATSGVG
jgi:hypothetical protein